jgi:hypothetical protein
MTVRLLLILVAICFSTTAVAQSAPPKVGNTTGSGKAERADSLQTRWNSSRHEAMGR